MEKLDYSIIKEKEEEEGGIVVYINLDFEDLTKEDLEGIERDCLNKYNDLPCVYYKK